MVVQATIIYPMTRTLPPFLRNISSTTLLALLFVSLVAAFTVSQLVISARRAERTRLFVFDPSDVTAVTIEDGEKKTRIERSSGTFVFRSPYAGKMADPRKVRAYCEALAALPIVRDIGTFAIGASTPFGIGPSAARVTVERGRTTTQAILGRNSPVAELCYVYLPSRSAVVLTPLGARQLLTFAPVNFRDNQLLAFNPADLGAIEIRHGKSGVAFEKIDAVWMARDRGTGKTYACDTPAVTRLAAAVASISIQDFEPADNGLSPAACGLSFPRVSVSVVSSTGARVTGALGGSYGDTLAYASRDGVVAGGVPAEWVTMLSTGAAAYARTYIIDFTPARIVSFTRTVIDGNDTYDKKRGTWFRTAKLRRPYDLEKMNMFLFYLSALKAERYYGEEDLGAVSASYVFRERDGTQLLTLEIGEEQDEYTKVRINGRGAVMGVASEIARLMEL